ncbi:UNVERIFIED_CONTAM: spore germination protein (amino acid permease) [Acetivibrio alkalicellulosi]
MENKIIFGRAEAISVLIIIMTTQLFISFPRLMAESGGNAGWLLTIYVTLLSLFFFMIISKLYKPFEGKDILDIGEYVAGNTGRILVGVIILITYVFIISIVLREFSDGLKILAFEKSPVSFIMIFFLIGMILAAYYGLEPLTRYSAIIVPIIAAAFLFIIIGVVPNFDTNNIIPILGKGPSELFLKGATKISVYSGLSILFLIPPFLGNYNNFKKTGYYSIILSSIFLTGGSLVYSLAIPYPATTEFVLPIYTLARFIDLGRFFKRIESVFLLAWATSAYIYLSIVLFFIVYVYKKAFKLKYHSPLIMPFSILIFTFALLPESMMAALELESNIFRVFAWIVTFCMPLFLLTIASIIKKKKRVKK